MGKASKPKHTAYYDLLECEPDATLAQLKKGYYKAARRLHPDRGGNEEEFKEMKNAYDSLCDPARRKVYDNAGPDGLKVMDGQMPSGIEFLKNLRKRDKFLIVLVLSIFSIFILVFPILLSIRWDAEGKNKTPYSWFIPFIPLFILQVLVCASFTAAVKQEPLDLSNPDLYAEDKDAWNAMEKQLNILRAKFWTVNILILAFEILIALLLDNIISISWYVVFLPMMLLSFLTIIARLLVVVSVFTSKDPDFHKPNEEEGLGGENNTSPTCSRKLLGSPKFLFFVIAYVKWSLASFITCFLISFVADNNETHASISFWITAIPYLLVIGMALVAVEVIACVTPVKQQAEQTESSSTTETQKQHAKSMNCSGLVSGFIVWLCSYGMLLIVVTTAAAKLSDINAFSGFAIFAPLFFIVCCLCCCLSIFFICVDLEDIEKAEMGAHGQRSSAKECGDETGGAGEIDHFVPPPSQTTYGATDVENVQVAIS